MKSHKNFFHKDENRIPFGKKGNEVIRDKDGKVHVAMTTNIFSDVSKTLLASNSMLAGLLSDVQPCVEPYSTKEKIVLDIYETTESDELSRQTVILGFKKYVNGCLYGQYKQHMGRFFLFFSFLVIGVLIEVLLYAFLSVDGSATIPWWIFKSVEVLASLFIWQFGGYLAFEFLGEKKNINRYKQIANCEFNIKHWD